MESKDNTNTTMDPKLAAAIVGFQAELAPVKKKAENPHFRSSYADAADVQRVVRPLLAKHKLGVAQPIRTDGDRYIIKTRIFHESGAYLEDEMELLLGKKDMQGLGSAITYGRRYHLMAMLDIVAEGEDDDGNAASNRGGQQTTTSKPPIGSRPSTPPAKKAPEPPKYSPTSAQIDEMYKVGDQAGIPRATVNATILTLTDEAHAKKFQAYLDAKAVENSEPIIVEDEAQQEPES